MGQNLKCSLNAPFAISSASMFGSMPGTARSTSTRLVPEISVFFTAKSGRTHSPEMKSNLIRDSRKFVLSQSLYAQFMLKAGGYEIPPRRGFCGDVNRSMCSNSFRSRAPTGQGQTETAGGGEKETTAGPKGKAANQARRTAKVRAATRSRKSKERHGQTEAPAERTGESDKTTAEAIHLGSKPERDFPARLADERSPHSARTFPCQLWT